MKYAALALVCMIGPVMACLLILWISSLFVSRKKLYTTATPYYRWAIHSICWVSLLFGHVRLIGDSLAGIPEGQALYVCNHRSNYDPVVLEWLLKRRKNTFVTKPENFGIFVVGQIARRNCCIPINRKNPRMALEAIAASADLINKGEYSVTVFPEGTRSREGKILEFHNAVFRIAKMAGVPVAAFYLDGTQKIKGNMPWKRTDVKVTVADVISAEELKTMSTVQIGNRIRNRYLQLNGEGTENE